MQSKLIEEVREVFEKYGFSVAATDIVKPTIECYLPYRKYVYVVEHCTGITFHLIERKETTE